MSASNGLSRRAMRRHFIPTFLKHFTQSQRKVGLRCTRPCGTIREQPMSGLEELVIPAPRDRKWSAVQVERLLEAAAAPLNASARAAEGNVKHVTSSAGTAKSK